MDFTKAENSRNHKSSFDKTVAAAQERINSITTDYKSAEAHCESARKEFAELREECIKICKKNNIKLDKQLSKCTREELFNQLTKLLPILPIEDRRFIGKALVDIEIDYDTIEKYGAIREKCLTDLGAFRIIEEDYEEEVVFTIPKKKTATEQITEKLETAAEENVADESNIIEVSEEVEEIDDKEEVISVKKASQELITKKNKMLHVDIVEESPVLDSVIDDDALTYNGNDVNYDEDILSSITRELEVIDAKSDEETINEFFGLNPSDIEEIAVVPEEDPDSVPFTINNDLTLVEIAEVVYKDPNVWKNIYEFRTNKSIIDRKAAEYGMSAEDISATQGCLNGVTLMIPTIIEYYVETESAQKRVA